MTGPHTAREEQVLQGNFNHQFRGVENTPDIAELTLFNTEPSVHLRVGASYVLFISFHRSGACPSALFALHDPDQALTLLYGRFGPEAPRGFQLVRRFVPMPRRISYEQLVRRLQPTGGPLYAPDDGESWCPGP
ncbi:MAG: hypothetical protein M3137_05325 [Actinomycetota bacterium]|nr:hypothetical protein [Actinomycetota bacterium]